MSTIIENHWVKKGSQINVRASNICRSLGNCVQLGSAEGEFCTPTLQISEDAGSGWRNFKSVKVFAEEVVASTKPSKLFPSRAVWIFLIWRLPSFSGVLSSISRVTCLFNYVFHVRTSWLNYRIRLFGMYRLYTKICLLITIESTVEYISRATIFSLMFQFCIHRFVLIISFGNSDLSLRSHY